MSPVSYTYEPGASVFVLIPGTCPATFNAAAATVNRVEIKVSQSLPVNIVTTNYVVSVLADSSIRTVNEIDVFVDKDTAVATAMARYHTTFN